MFANRSLSFPYKSNKATLFEYINTNLIQYVEFYLKALLGSKEWKYELKQLKFDFL